MSEASKTGECYVCLEETDETSCQNNCFVHDSCLRKGLEHGLPNHCTVCRAPLHLRTTLKTECLRELIVCVTICTQMTFSVIFVFALIFFIGMVKTL